MTASFNGEPSRRRGLNMAAQERAAGPRFREPSARAKSDRRAGRGWSLLGIRGAMICPREQSVHRGPGKKRRRRLFELPDRAIQGFGAHLTLNGASGSLLSLRTLLSCHAARSRLSRQGPAVIAQNPFLGSPETAAACQCVKEKAKHYKGNGKKSSARGGWIRVSASHLEGEKGESREAGALCVFDLRVKRRHANRS
jgi:hypothetical protein